MKKTLNGIAFGLAVLGLAGIGCGGSGGQEQETTPAATVDPAATPAPEPAGPPHLKFAEMTIYEGTKAIFKIHADGKTEVAGGAEPNVTWGEGPVVQADGTIQFKGQKVAKVEQDGTVKNLRTNEVIPVKIGADTLTASGPGGDVVLQIKEDGTIAVPGAPPDKNLRVEGATDAETRRTAIALIGAIFLSGKASAPAEPAPAPAPSGAAPAPSGQPAPSATPAPAPAPAPTKPK